MFEKIVIRRAGSAGTPLTAGRLAEALLFYKKVVLLLDNGSLNAITNAIGTDNLFTLVDDGYIDVTYVSDMLAVQTETKNNIQAHDFVAFKFAGSAGKGPIKNKEKLMEDTLGRFIQNDGKNIRKITRKFMDRIPIKNSNDLIGMGDICRLCRADIFDDSYLNSSVRIVLETLLPGTPIPPFTSKAIKGSWGFYLSSNLNFDDLNQSYHRIVSPQHSTLTPASVLGHILQARFDLALSARYMSEYATNDLSSKLIQRRLADVMHSLGSSQNELEMFQNMVLDNSKAIAQCIDSRQRSFSEFMRLLEEASKFKEWLCKAHPDRGMINEYLNEVSSKTWLDTVPNKLIRFVLFSAGGLLLGASASPLVAIGGTLALSMIDQLVLDKLIKGWRPDQFVQGPLNEFVNG